MTKFYIDFHPPIPRIGNGKIPDIPNWPELYEIVERKDIQDVSMIFILDGSIFEYYPSTPVDILDDILTEINNIVNHADHVVCISGYPILTAFFKNGKFILQGASSININNSNSGELSSDELLKIFREAANDIISYIMTPGW